MWFQLKILVPIMGAKLLKGVKSFENSRNLKFLAVKLAQ